jgi:hypothetical protein
MSQSSQPQELRALAAKLAAVGVPSGRYSLGKHQNERACLVEADGQWLVYYAERGRREDMHTFSTFAEAGELLFRLVRE